MFNTSAHVLLNLLNKLRKRDKMRGLLSIVSLFCNKFNNFNNTGAQMSDSIYQRILKLLKKCIFLHKNIKICHLLRNSIMDIIM